MTSFYVQSNFNSNTSKVAEMTIILVLHILPVVTMLTFDIYLADLCLTLLLISVFV